MDRFEHAEMTKELVRIGDSLDALVDILREEHEQRSEVRARSRENVEKLRRVK